MIKNLDYKKQILVEQFNEFKLNGGEEPATLKEYVERESENDPGFFRWLFDDDLDDFGFNLSKEQGKEYKEFINKL